MRTALDKLDTARNLVAAGNVEEANMMLNTFGVEHFTTPDGQGFAHLNTGETYQDTVIWPENDQEHAFISSWGDIFETAENDYCEENNVIRCAWCGEYTDMDKEDWREVVCSSCGHNVGG